MPYSFAFDSDHRILLVVLEGNVGDAEMLQIDNEVRTYIAKLHPSGGITDATLVSNFDVSSQTIRTLARRHPPYPQTTPRFLVAPTDYLFGLARMYQLSGNREQMQVVRSREEALAALGVQSAKFETLAQTNPEQQE